MKTCERNAARAERDDRSEHPHLVGTALTERPHLADLKRRTIQEIWWTRWRA
jgi:hypothetical protein